MPRPIFRRLDSSSSVPESQQQEQQHRHQENPTLSDQQSLPYGYMSKAERAVVEMDSTDSSTEITSVEQELSQSDRLDSKLSCSSSGEIPSLVKEDDEKKPDRGAASANLRAAADVGPMQTLIIEEKKSSDTHHRSPATPVTPDSPMEGTFGPKKDAFLEKNDDVVSNAGETVRTSSSGMQRAKEIDVSSAPSSDDPTPYLPELQSPSDAKVASASAVELPKLSLRSSSSRPRRGRIVSLDRGRSDQGSYSTFEDTGYHSNDSTSGIHTDGELGRRNSSSSHHGRKVHQHIHHDNSGRYNYRDDDSSSDDDSSYFATHLPSPKSGRSFSLSSTASAPARTEMFPLTKQESDASLSFSDESDEEEHHHHSQQQQQQHRSHGNLPHPDSRPINLQEARQLHGRQQLEDQQHQQNASNSSSTPLTDRVHLAPVVHPNRPVADMHLYPQRITRMHSVSSLVSSTSDDSREDDDFTDDETNVGGDATSGDATTRDATSGSGSGTGPSRPRASTSGSSSMSSDPELMVTDDAMEAAAAAGMAMATGMAHGYRPSSQFSETSGRRSPIQGQHNPGSCGGFGAFHFDGTPTPQRSPPPLQQDYLTSANNRSFLPHPQPQQAMSTDQMMAWAVAASAVPASSAPLGLTGSALDFGQPSQFHQYQNLQTPAFGPTLHGLNHQPTGTRNMSDHSYSSTSGSIPLVYSEDDIAVNAGMYTTTTAAASSLGKPVASASGSGGMAALTGSDSSGGFGFGQGNEPGLPSDNLGNKTQEILINNAAAVAASAPSTLDKDPSDDPASGGRQVFKVYWQRWIMLMYMSILNLLSDWTCYSVAPISLLTEEAFGNIDPERLVVVFLGANAIATACEPIILARLGLRRTVLFGALLLTIGSIVKSGGLPPIIPANLEKGHAEISLYLGFFLVGLSQPLYQCTPALLSASWFPEEERTMATGVALNANQLGIGFAFVFGTLLVAEADDIPGYFGLLSQIATIVFIGTLIQFDDAPPTPPSSSARAMRGDFKMRMPRVGSIVGRMRTNLTSCSQSNVDEAKAEAPSPATSLPVGQKREPGKHRRRSSSGRRGSATRRRANLSARSHNALTESGLAAPSSAHYGSTAEAMERIARTKAEVFSHHAEAPSPAPMSGVPQNVESNLGSPDQDEPPPETQQPGVNPVQGTGLPPMMPGASYGYTYPALPYQYPPYWADPRMQQQPPPPYYQQAYYQQQAMHGAMGQPGMPPPPLPPGQPRMPFFPPTQQMPLPYPHQQHFPVPLQNFDPYYNMYEADLYEEGAEPIVTITDHHLDINIRDDQVIRSLHACMIRKGFSHALASFTVSGIVINTLSTFMDYLVRLNGAPRTYTGIVGGTFQFVIMMSSLVVGKQTDKTRAYYSVTIAMLVLGAFGLAECGVSLDSDRGGDLRWSLVVVAALVGPLQPVSTELGVEVAYPLSENTVLVIQQLFSNLLSAIFIPFFKALKDVGSTTFVDGEMVQRPDYTFSFYLLIVLHTGVTVYFATFNGKYLRYEHESERKAEEDRQDAEAAAGQAMGGGDGIAVHPFYANEAPYAGPTGEQQPLLQSPVV